MHGLRWKLCAVFGISVSAALLLFATFQDPSGAPRPVYLGFDRNDYPGDQALPILQNTFSFTGYWIGPPPGEKISTWSGKRDVLKRYGFGFLVLFNGPESRKLKSVDDAWSKGDLDAATAAKLARQEGFAAGTVIFLDIEEGGRLSAPYHAYVGAWTDAVMRETFRVGIYCSAMPVDEGGGATITTARDLEDHLAGKKVVFWVFNYACPPAPGCTFTSSAAVSQGGWPSAVVWQYAQSPRPKPFTTHCAAAYAKDGNCYAPDDKDHQWFLDANVATSANPSAPPR